MAVPLEQPGVLATVEAIRLAQGRAAEVLAAAENARTLALAGARLGDCDPS